MKTINGIGRRGWQAPGITGRDGYIIAQALYWFIREQQELPNGQFEWSNTEDAKLILLTQFPGAGEFFAKTERAGRKPANLELEFEGYLQAADNVVTFKR